MSDAESTCAWSYKRKCSKVEIAFHSKWSADGRIIIIILGKRGVGRDRDGWGETGGGEMARERRNSGTLSYVVS